jgi:hypothetical protein
VLPGWELPVEEVGVVDVPGGQVGEGAGTLVLGLEPRCATRSPRQRRGLAPERLQLRLLVGADHVLVGPPLEAALVEVEHPPCLLGEGGIADEDPVALLPRLQRVVMQPTPDR